MTILDDLGIMLPVLLAPRMASLSGKESLKARHKRHVQPPGCTHFYMSLHSEYEVITTSAYLLSGAASGHWTVNPLFDKVDRFSCKILKQKITKY